jgi:hypothetical protein
MADQHDSAGGQESGGRGRVTVPRWALVAGGVVLVLALCATGYLAVNGGDANNNETVPRAAGDSGSASTTTNAASSTGTTGTNQAGGSGASAGGGSSPTTTSGAPTATDPATTTTAPGTTTTQEQFLIPGTTTPRPTEVWPTCPAGSHVLKVPYGQECLTDQPVNGQLIEVDGICPPGYRLKGTATAQKCYRNL